MNRAFKAAIAALIFAVGFAGSVAAGPLEDADAARQRGDYATAKSIIQPLADQGYPRAQYEIGNLYLFGQGVPQSYAEALKWYRKAAEQGYPRAQLDLGWMYQYDTSVLNYAEAVKWYRKAAGVFTEAQHRLGLMYEDGLGVPQNYVLAYMWYNLSAGAEFLSYSPDSRNKLAARMTSAQIAEGQRMS